MELCSVKSHVTCSGLKFEWSSFKSYVVCLQMLTFPVYTSLYLWKRLIIDLTWNTPMSFHDQKSIEHHQKLCLDNCSNVACRLCRVIGSDGTRHCILNKYPSYSSVSVFTAVGFTLGYITLILSSMRSRHFINNNVFGALIDNNCNKGSFRKLKSNWNLTFI